MVTPPFSFCVIPLYRIQGNYARRTNSNLSSRWLDKPELVDKSEYAAYNDANLIGQFVTILSVNKTRGALMGIVGPSFFVL